MFVLFGHIEASEEGDGTPRDGDGGGEVLGVMVAVLVDDVNDVVVQGAGGEDDVKPFSAADGDAVGLIRSLGGDGATAVVIVPGDGQVAVGEDVDGAAAREFLPVFVGDGDALDGHVALHGNLDQASYVAELHGCAVVASNGGVVAFAKGVVGKGLDGLDGDTIEFVVVDAEPFLGGIDAVVRPFGNVIGDSAYKGGHTVGEVGQDECRESVASSRHADSVLLVPFHAVGFGVVVGLGIAVLDGDDGVVVGALQRIVLLAANKDRSAQGSQQGYVVNFMLHDCTFGGIENEEL